MSRPSAISAPAELTLADFRSRKPLRDWLASDPNVRLLLATLQGERSRAIARAQNAHPLPLTENARLGVFLGYDAALEVLAEAALLPDAQPSAHPDPTFLADNNRERP